MGKMFSALDERLTAFIAGQKIFFTATAPEEGRINLSPKGIDTFRCLDHHTVAYLDLTGSGSEAAAHLIENGRMTIMFCAFDGAPLILRLYGQGHVVRPRDPEWSGLMANFNPLPGQRQIVVLRIESVQTSCGFGVPCFDYAGERRLLLDWSAKKGSDGLEEYWREKNQVSIDGLPTRLVSH